jgi:hypothetical protein
VSRTRGTPTRTSTPTCTARTPRWRTIRTA